MRTKVINPEVLIEALVRNAQAAGNRQLEQRLADLTVWYYRNKKAIAADNLHLRQKLLENAFWIMLEVNALMLARLQEVDIQRKSKDLWIPNGMKVEGDLVTNAD